MVAGVIVLAVAEHLAVEHPHEHVQWSYRARLRGRGPCCTWSGSPGRRSRSVHGRVLTAADRLSRPGGAGRRRPPARPARGADRDAAGRGRCWPCWPSATDGVHITLRTYFEPTSGLLANPDGHGIDDRLVPPRELRLELPRCRAFARGRPRTSLPRARCAASLALPELIGGAGGGRRAQPLEPVRSTGTRTPSTRPRSSRWPPAGTTSSSTRWTRPG